MYALPSTDIGVSAFSGKESRAAAYTRIQLEIEALEAAICAWKNRHNTLSIVSRLPPETLSTIFQWHSLICKEGSPQSLHWIRLSHVCSHWHRVALDSPRLWSSIDFKRPVWAREMLIRSKMSPVTVNIGVVGPVDQADLHQVLKQLFRIQELSLSGDFYSSDTLDELRKSAPLLEALIVDRGDMQGPGPSSKDIVLGITPNLRYLDVCYGCFSWSDMPIFHQLTTLKLSHIPFRAQPPTVTQLLFALKVATNLETLVLLGINLPPSQDEVSQSGPIALLPYLSHIEIRSDFSSCMHLCRRISHPTPAYMKILCDIPKFYHSTDLLTEAPADSLSEMIKKSVGPVKCLSMVLARDPDAYLGVHSIRTWPAPGPHWVPTISPPQFELQMVSHGLFSGFAAAEFIRAVSVSLPLRDLQSLHVGNMYLREEFWVETFGHLEELRNIRLEKSGGNGFLCALSAGILDSDEEGDYEPATMNFLGLHTLVCDEWEFDDRENDESPDLSQFLYYLQDRYGYQVALQDVYLWDCQNVDEDDIARMRAAVGRLHWDGDAEAGSDSDVNSYENSDDE